MIWGRQRDGSYWHFVREVECRECRGPGKAQVCHALRPLTPQRWSAEKVEIHQHFVNGAPRREERPVWRIPGLSLAKARRLIRRDRRER